MENFDDLKDIANNLRALAMDSVYKAQSGHLGLALGCADIAAYLWYKFMIFDPKDPNWIGRDRFILSAGHGSILLYSILHFCGYDISIEDLKYFRRSHSKLPGHPEFGKTPGVEATTGPLGQGFANAVGEALGLKILQSKFSNSKDLFSSKIITLVGDGCIMEGVSSEASSLAGHWCLNNLIAIYDDNGVSLDDYTSITLSDDTEKRYISYGWDVIKINGHDFEEIDKAFKTLRHKQEKPTLIIVKTVIGKGIKNIEGTYKAHGNNLSKEDIQDTKKKLNLLNKDFYTDEKVYKVFNNRYKDLLAKKEEWNKKFTNWKQNNVNEFILFESLKKKYSLEELEEILSQIKFPTECSTRESSHIVINALCKRINNIYVGSADLSSSDKTYIENSKHVEKNDFSGRNIKYGIREFAMGCITSGLAYTGFFKPVCGTFFVFSDYLRASIRLAAISNIPVIYHFSHDSIFVGQDGPTHHPVEQLVSLRAMPNLLVIRPADGNEVVGAWIAAILNKGPTAIILSRNSLKNIEETKTRYKDGVGKGAYFVINKEGPADYIIFATGSELHIAINIANLITDKNVKVVSFPSWELFEKQSDEYKSYILSHPNAKKISIEAGIDIGWHKYIGNDGITISIKDYCESARSSVLEKDSGFDITSILEKIMNE